MSNEELKLIRDNVYNWERDAIAGHLDRLISSLTSPSIPPADSAPKAALTDAQIDELVKKVGATYYSPPPMRAVRGYSFTYEQLNEFVAALLSAQSVKVGDAKDLPEPFWHAVVSDRAPILNKAIRSEEVAYEYLAKCDQADARVEQLFTADQMRKYVIAAIAAQGAKK